MSFPNNVTRVAISSYKNVDYDVKPAKMRFTSHENILIHPLLLPVSSQREQTIGLVLLIIFIPITYKISACQHLINCTVYNSIPIYGFK